MSPVRRTNLTMLVNWRSYGWCGPRWWGV